MRRGLEHAGQPLTHPERVLRVAMLYAHVERELMRAFVLGDGGVNLVDGTDDPGPFVFHVLADLPLRPPDSAMRGVDFQNGLRVSGHAEQALSYSVEPSFHLGEVVIFALVVTNRPVVLRRVVSSDLIAQARLIG